MDAQKFPHNSLGTDRPEKLYDVLCAFSNDVVEQVTLDEARRMKATGEAYFCNSGRSLRLVPSVQQELDRRDQKGSAYEWQTVHASELCPEQKRAFGARLLRITTFQYQPFAKKTQTSEPTPRTPNLDELDAAFA